MQFAIKQGCSNHATQHQELAALLHTVSFVVLVPSIFFALAIVVWIGLHPLTAGATAYALAGLGIVLTVLATLVLRFQARMSLLQKNWEDLLSEFRGGDVQERLDAELSDHSSDPTDRVAPPSP